MNVTYDTLALHDLGEITISQAAEFEGGENPIRARRTITVGIDVFEDTFAANYALLAEAKQKLKVQHGILRWEDPASGTVYVNQPAVVGSENLPDDPNGWGRYHQRLEITFTFFEQDISNSAGLVRLAFGAGSNIDFTQMTTWSEELQVERVHALHSERRTATVRVNVSGLELGNPLQTVANRRTALHTKRDEWRAKVLSAKFCTLTNGSFSQVVRVENFKCEVNQSVNAIEWSFSAFYTAHPDEADYSIAEYRVRERNGTEQPAAGTGEQFLTISGTVTANSEAVALTRINELRNAQVAARGYAAGEMTSNEIERGETAVLDGTVFLERTFTLEFRRWRSDNHSLTLQKETGGAIQFGQVTGFAQGYNARRFNEQRSQRQFAGGRVELRGTLWLGAWDAAVAGRRTLLTARVQQMEEACNGADGRLIYGTHFDRRVRVEDFRAEVNQQLTGIEWSLTAGYSLFPNEAGYATAEFTVEQAESVEDGDVVMSFTGRILAQSETAARSKLDALRTTVLADYGYALKQLLRPQTTVNKVFANGDRTNGLVEAADGTTFIELTFSEAYRKRMSALVSWNLRVSDTEEDRAGFIATTYSGSVTASGSDATAAYATALAKAQSLGDNKWPFRVRSSVTWTQRQTRAENDVEFVTLEFNYEYQRKGGARVYVEINSATVTSTFGNDSENISGFVSAADLATAQGHYQTLVRDALVVAGRLILDEETGEGTQRMQGSAGGAFDAQFVRFDFRMTLFKRRAAGREAIRYVIDTAKDWLSLTQTSTVSGSCWAATEAEARAAVAAFLGSLTLGTQRSTRTSAERMQWKPEATSETEFGRLDFDESFEDRITGEAGIISCEVSEEIEFSNTRWVEQPLPRLAGGDGGVSLMQDTGVTPGRRSVRGTVTAATRAIGHAWAAKQRTAFLTGDADENHYETAPSLATTYSFVPRTEGVVAGTEENVKVTVLNFAYGELLPNYPYVAPGA